MDNMKITRAQQIKDILETIPAEKFQTDYLGWCRGAVWAKNNGNEDNGCSCFLGHIHRHFNPSDTGAIGDKNGYGARQLTASFLEKVHGIMYDDGVSVNNSDRINGYNEPEIKDRVMHLVNDMIKAGY